MDNPIMHESMFDGDEDGFDPSRTVYVANLVREVGRDQLKEFFSVVGSVTKAAVASRRGDGDLNYAFVEFKEIAQADKARILSGTTLRAKPVIIQPATAPGVPALPGQSAYQTFAALAGMPVLPPGVAAAPGAPVVGPNGPFPPQMYPTVMPALPPAPQPGSTPFYGNNMQTPEEVARTIYVGNINETVNAEHLINFFSVCGPINFCRMAGDSTHPSRYSFIEFQTFEASQKAMQLNGMILVDRPLRVNKSKNPIVRPQIEKKSDARDKQFRDRKLAAVVESINRRVLGSPNGAPRDSHRSHRSHSRSRSRSRSRSPSRKHRSSHSSKRSRHHDEELPPAKRDKHD